MVELTHSSMNHRIIRDQVARYPMVAFIILAYAISCAWLLNFHVDLGVVNGFGIIGSMSPSLAAMIISALLRPQSSGVPAGKRWRLFGMIGIWVLAIMTVLRIWHWVGLVTVSGMVSTTFAYPTFAAFLIDVLAAAVAAYVLSGVYARRQGVRDLLHSLDLRCQSVRWYWWVIAAGLYPVVFTLGNAISAGVGLPEPAPKVTGTWYWLVLSLPMMFLYFLFGGGGLEEPGWRGFVLPLLQKRHSPLHSSLILAVIWALWHWPYAVSGGDSLIMVFFLLQCIPLAILFTAIFNLTGGSLPIVILLHTSINMTDTFLPVSALARGLWMLLILCVAIWMWRSARALSAEMPDLLTS